MKMLHVTIQTKNFEEEIKFYQEQVGLVMQNDMRPMGRNMVFLANGEGETQVEIIENTESTNAGNQFISVGFATEDVAGKRDELRVLGFEVTPMINPAPGVEFFFVTDPAGVKVQFMAAHK